MKKLFYSIVLLLFVFNSAVYSQETNEKADLKEEISISASNLKFENLSFKYARLLSDDLWLKLGAINISGNTHKNIPFAGDFVSKNTNFNSGLLLGIDKHKSLTSKLEFVYGLNLQMNYSYFNQTTENPMIPVDQRSITLNTYAPGVGLGLGIFYKINPSVLFGFEANPSVNYTFMNGKNPGNGIPYKQRGINFSFINNVDQVTLKVHF